ncbi:MAG TPA: hypothetical protein VGC16_12205 [Rhizomicrobium sp.]
MRTIATVSFAVAALVGTAGIGAAVEAVHWEPRQAAAYLDQRAAWWQGWPPARRGGNTVCLSCHTMLPYALSRPLLRKDLAEKEIPLAEQTMLSHITKRMAGWDAMQPYYDEKSAPEIQARMTPDTLMSFYSDERFGAGKTAESRSTEAIVNTLALVSESQAHDPTHLTPVAQSALKILLPLQLTSGDDAGGWNWQNFHLAPWETEGSRFLGTSYVALTLGRTPAAYRATPEAQHALTGLNDYFAARQKGQSLFNRLHQLWAARALPDLLPAADIRADLRKQVLDRQLPDGSWRLYSLGGWARYDGSMPSADGDGYATGLAVLALPALHDPDADAAVRRGRAWLASHQQDGYWRAASLNKQRDPNTDPSRFMNDAATAYAVQALLSDTR